MRLPQPASLRGAHKHGLSEQTTDRLDAPVILDVGRAHEHRSCYFLVVACQTYTRGDASPDTTTPRLQDRLEGVGAPSATIRSGYRLLTHQPVSSRGRCSKAVPAEKNFRGTPDTNYPYSPTALRSNCISAPASHSAPLWATCTGKERVGLHEPYVKAPRICTRAAIAAT